jgi:hypothetical protein
MEGVMLKGLVKKPEVAKPVAVDYGTHINSKPITAMVTSEKKGAGQEWPGATGEAVTLHPGVFSKKQTGMSITVGGGRTLNLGNYESARVDVSVTVPCDPDSLNDAYEYGSDWVSDKIEEAVKAAKGL